MDFKYAINILKKYYNNDIKYNIKKDECFEEIFLEMNNYAEMDTFCFMCKYKNFIFMIYQEGWIKADIYIYENIDISKLKFKFLECQDLIK